MQQLRFYLRNGFTLHVSGDNLTHHQEWYNKICRQKRLTPKYINIRINGNKSKAIAENKNAIVASCWTYFATIKHDARNHKY